MTLDNVKMNVIKTAPNGAVNNLTIFNFTQHGHLISATYSGGAILNGYLVGTVKGQEVGFSYCQLEVDEKHRSGQSACKLSTNEDGKLQLIESFTWGPDQQSGVNILQEL